MCHSDLIGFHGEESGMCMKRHKFWAIATVICMALTMYTGYKRK